MAPAYRDTAVIIPCFNEERAIGAVVAAFKEQLPGAPIYVYDNASTDNTIAVAHQAGATVRSEAQRGKGNVMRRAFADIDAEIYLMTDGDGTYDAAAAPRMIAKVRKDKFDLVVGVRRGATTGAYRPGHVTGNRLFGFLFRSLFKASYTDILSGYRAMSRRFVKSMPLGAKGFEIELEMSAHAALLRLPVLEVETDYGARARGTVSKLNTWIDGARILRRMFRFLRLHRPRLVYGLLGASAAFVSVVLGLPVLFEYFDTGLVPRLPTLIVSVATMIVSVLFIVVGVILDAQSQYFAETKRLAYLRVPPPADCASDANDQATDLR